jgi:T5SS/PEP-CTERM-associated repeat protein
MARVGFNSRRLLAGALCILTSTFLSSVAHAQTNSWANPSRGFWDDTESWSLGILPTNAQSVFITNAPSKTVTIDSYTSGNYPESLTISNLTVSAPDGSTNTLFLDDAGLTPPLSVINTLDVDTNGALVVDGSVVQVSGDLVMGEYGYNGALTVINGGQVFSGSGAVGGYNGIYSRAASNNVAVVSGTGSVWSNSGDLYIGGIFAGISFPGPNNQLIVTNGGAVYSINGYVGGTVNGLYDRVLVTGSGSVWNNTGNLIVGSAEGGITHSSSPMAVRCTTTSGLWGRSKPATTRYWSRAAARCGATKMA